MKIKQLLTEQSIFIRWISFGSYGLAIGFLVALLIQVISVFLIENGLHIIDSPVWGAVPSVISGFMLGAFIGTFQSISLKHQVVHPFLWILASGLGLAVGVPCVYNNFWPETFWGGLAMGAILGLALGFTQWLVLRLKVNKSGLWIPASVVGAVLGAMATIFLVGLGDIFSSMGIFIIQALVLILSFSLFPLLIGLFL